MWKRFLLLATLGSAVLAPARDKPENWVQVRSPHFMIVSNSSEKQARRVADQFERMRSVFHQLFPKLQIDPSTPIIVLAIKDEKDFRALEPATYLAKGQVRLAGLFLTALDKNYVLMQLDAEGEHPYSVVYHEYTHLLLSKADWMPLWMNEGLAEYYQTTEIREKDVSVGEPSTENVMLLRQNRMLPLATLFTVDHSSPYYHEENKGSIFYAESWALTHYLRFKDSQQNTHRLTDYVTLLTQNVDPVTAATRAFGDLKKLQTALEDYVRQSAFHYMKMAATTEVDQSAFQAQALTNLQADAVRADFLAYNERTADARALLDHILQEDPKNVSAHETMGYLAYRQGHLEEARNWYAQAVKLDSQNFLAQYYFAAISMNGTVAPADETQVENSLRASIKLNPSFGPSYNELAVFLGMRHRNLDEARMMGLNAVQLEPTNVSYRLNVANILLMMERGKDAEDVIRYALHFAKTPQETATAETFLQHTEEYAEAQETRRRFNEELKAGQISTAQVTAAGGVPEAEGGSASPPAEEPVPKGPYRFMVGVLKDVRCNAPAMDLNLLSNGKTLGLHTGNYFKLSFSVLNVTLKGDLNPCVDLE
ncbi:MAG: tetratricopeptide repeat protein, partial [Candidatus Sulfotelmatobacter sp.]